MILPFNLKIGKISLNIEPSEQNNLENGTQNGIPVEISRSCNSIKEIVDRHMEATFGVASDAFSRTLIIATETCGKLFR